ncbi:hypothetical protein EI975_21205 [Bacillus licheniformis]|uniref:hypothetical protein n=1 Tax=Bacillus subtilis group TaxID=653685 RepID=UPI0011EF12EB|nr:MULTISPECIES: hypothetical protein [Bacillus subtilis group]KAA0817056.1 hypothetical protein EI974_09440 [Bacillus licheniformis]KAA0829955.1 hypothetical protein EI980_16425 [Bacillus licheniformis]KAA0835311.1 hypothetical protein EI979_20525 [Bacillus paralicheniformis]KAA0844467.1 hypothetical protein EI975_21205 [Bacillus licheniformis]
MFEGYHLQNRIHAFQNLDKPVYDPDVQLGVGESEELRPTHTNFLYPYLPKEALMDKVVTMSIEKATVDGNGNQVEEKEFPKQHFFGDPIGGLHWYGGI